MPKKMGSTYVIQQEDVFYVLGVGTNTVCEWYRQWLAKKDSFLKGIG